MNYLPKMYDEFKHSVSGIKAGNADAEFIGEGAESTVWRMTQSGLDYAVKLANEYSVRGRRRDVVGATKQKIVSGLRGQGIAGLEQLQAASPEEGALIYDYVNGITLSKMTDQDINNVTQDQVSALWRTVLSATQAGIEFDWMNSGGDNVIFNSESGFTLIDYWSASQKINMEENRKRVIKSLGPVGLKLVDVFDFGK
jgi:predicted Ser/Thr protein kinase